MKLMIQRLWIVSTLVFHACFDLDRAGAAPILGGADFEGANAVAAGELRHNGIG